MRITDLEVEGYGVWSGLRIEKFSDALNVLYGPNEAGKTTLLQFIRSMLYGFSPGRRRYLPPVHGGRPGGVLHLASPHGRFEIGRYDDSLPDGTPGEQVTLTAPDGTRQGEHFIKVLLSNVDEPVFNNVFAVGLREIQELATLSDTEAAELLYSLSAGLDRVSLVDVLRELENSRNRILDAAGKPCQVVQLLAEQEKLRGGDRGTRVDQPPLGPSAGRARSAPSGSHAAGGGRQSGRALDPRDGPGHCAARPLGAAGSAGRPTIGAGAAEGHARGRHRTARRHQRPHPATSAAARPSRPACARTPSGSLPHWPSTRPCGGKPRGSRPSRSRSRGLPNCRARSANCKARSASRRPNWPPSTSDWA